MRTKVAAAHWAAVITSDQRDLEGNDFQMSEFSRSRMNSPSSFKSSLVAGSLNSSGAFDQLGARRCYGMSIDTIDYSLFFGGRLLIEHLYLVFAAGVERLVPFTQLIVNLLESHFRRRGRSWGGLVVAGESLVVLGCPGTAGDWGELRRWGRRRRPFCMNYMASRT